MKVKFLKDCPCKIEKKLVTYTEGQIVDVNPKRDKWMIDCGYATLCDEYSGDIEKAEKSIAEVEENKAIEPEENKGFFQPKKKRGRPKKNK